MARHVLFTDAELVLKAQAIEDREWERDAADAIARRARYNTPWSEPSGPYTIDDDGVRHAA